MYKVDGVEVKESKEFKKVLEIAARTAAGWGQWGGRDAISELLWVTPGYIILALLSYPNPVLEILAEEIGLEFLVDEVISCYAPKDWLKGVNWRYNIRPEISCAKEEVRWGQTIVYPEHLFLAALRWQGEIGEAIRKFIVHHVGNEGFFRIRSRLTESALGRDGLRV